MPKGAYKINNDLPGPGPGVTVTSGKDASFAACIASLLVFFSICIIIVLATMPWRSAPAPYNHHQVEQGGNTAKASGGHYGFTTFQPQIKETTMTTDTSTYDPLSQGEIDAVQERQSDDVESFTVSDDTSHVTSNRTHENIKVAANSSESDEVNSTSSSVHSSVYMDDGSSGISKTSPYLTSITTPSTLGPVIITTTAEVYNEEANRKRSNDTDHSITVDQESTNNDLDEELCESGQCKSLASRMLGMLNHSMDACNDFYEYACGGLRHSRWMLPSHPELRTEERIRVGMSKVTRESLPHYHQFMHFYESCLTYQTDHSFEQRVQKARKALSKAGTLHDRSTWNANETIHLTHLLSRLFKMHSTPLFDVLLDVSASGRGSFSLRLTPPLHRSVLLDVAGVGHTTSSEIPPAHCREETDPISPTRGQHVDLNDAYNKYIECTQNFAPFLDGVEDSLKSLEAFASLAEFNRSTYLVEIRQLVNSVLDVKKEHLPKVGKIRNQILAKQYTLTNISALQDSYTIVDWRVLIQSLLNKTLPDSTQVQLYFPEYFDSLFEELSTADGRQTNNMLLGMLAHELYTGLVAENPSCDRSSLCLESARTLMDDVAVPLYLASFQPAQIQAFKDKSHDLFSRTKQAMAQELKTAQWLDDGSRTTLLAKLDDMTLELGTEKSAFTPEKSMAQIAADADFFDMFLSLLRRMRKRMYADYWSAPQSAQQLWSHFSSPTHTSGTAIYGLNAIMLPLGVNSMPHFYPGAPHYIHMATLGTLIAHEMAHHFDSTGVNFDSMGRKDLPQLQSKAMQLYQEVKRLAVEQYSYPRSFSVDSGGILAMTLDAELSLNERLADLTASHVAQATYEAWLVQDVKRGVREGHRVLPWLGMTWRQAFFVAQAQTYCDKHEILEHRISLFEQEHFPPFERVNDMVRNSKQFAEAFSCVGGQQMNLELKIPPFPAFDMLTQDENYSATY